MGQPALVLNIDFEYKLKIDKEKTWRIIEILNAVGQVFGNRRVWKTWHLKMGGKLLDIEVETGEKLRENHEKSLPTRTVKYESVVWNWYEKYYQRNFTGTPVLI